MKKTLFVIGFSCSIALAVLAQGIFGDGTQPANFASVKINGTPVIDTGGNWVGGGGSGGNTFSGQFTNSGGVIYFVNSALVTNLTGHGTITQTNASNGSSNLFNQGGYFGYNAATGVTHSLTNGILTAASATLSGTVTAGTFSGSGSSLTGIPTLSANSNIWSGNLDFNGGVPTVTTNGGGASPGTTVTLQAGSTDTSGVIQIVTGASAMLTSTNLFTFTLHSTRNNALRIFVTPIGTDITANLMVSARSLAVGVSMSQWIMMIGASAWSAGKTYTIAYWCPGM